MSRERRAFSTLAIVAAFAIPLAVASVAFACARLATLKLDRAGARPGTTVGAIGLNYNNDSQSSPVALRFNSRRGRVLWEGRADSRGRIRARFETPSVRRGYYVIVATQQTAEGRPAAGTPGRAPLRVRRARSRSRSSAAAPTPVAGPGSTDGGLPPSAVPLLLFFGAAGAGTLAVALRRRARRPLLPAR